MEIYGVNLPEPKPENAARIVKISRQRHQQQANRRKKNTRAKRWDTYWVRAYDAVLVALGEKVDEQNPKT